MVRGNECGLGRKEEKVGKYKAEARKLEAIGGG